MEHRGDRHVHVIGAEQPHAVDTAHDRRHPHGVQHQLPVSEIHTLGVTRGTGGVESRGDRVFVEVLELILSTRSRQQVLVLADQIGQIGGLFRGIGQQNSVLDRGQLPGNGLIEPHELAVDQHELIFGVVHGVENLVR